MDNIAKKLKLLREKENKRKLKATPEYKKTILDKVLKNREQIKALQATDAYKKRKKEKVANLTDEYVRGLLANKTKIFANCIPKELVEVKRLQLLIKREVINGQYK